MKRLFVNFAIPIAACAALLLSSPKGHSATGGWDVPDGTTGGTDQFMPNVDYNVTNNGPGKVVFEIKSGGSVTETIPLGPNESDTVRIPGGSTLCFTDIPGDGDSTGSYCCPGN